jgi:hypothetical protein
MGVHWLLHVVIILSRSLVVLALSLISVIVVAIVHLSLRSLRHSVRIRVVVVRVRVLLSCLLIIGYKSLLVRLTRGLRNVIRGGPRPHVVVVHLAHGRSVVIRLLLLIRNIVRLRDRGVELRSS